MAFALILFAFAAVGRLSVAVVVISFQLSCSKRDRIAATDLRADTPKNRRARDTSGHCAGKKENSGKIGWHDLRREEGVGTSHLLKVRCFFKLDVSAPCFTLFWKAQRQ